MVMVAVARIPDGSKVGIDLLAIGVGIESQMSDIEYE